MLQCTERQSDIYDGFTDISNYLISGMHLMISKMNFWYAVSDTNNSIMDISRISKFFISEIRITDIPKSNYWYHRFEFLISANRIFDFIN